MLQHTCWHCSHCSCQTTRTNERSGQEPHLARTTVEQDNNRRARTYYPPTAVVFAQHVCDFPYALDDAEHCAPAACAQHRCVYTRVPQYNMCVGTRAQHCVTSIDHSTPPADGWPLTCSTRLNAVVHQFSGPSAMVWPHLLLGCGHPGEPCSLTLKGAHHVMGIDWEEVSGTLDSDGDWDFSAENARWGAALDPTRRPSLRDVTCLAPVRRQPLRYVPSDARISLAHRST